MGVYWFGIFFTRLNYRLNDTKLSRDSNTVNTFNEINVAIYMKRLTSNLLNPTARNRSSNESGQW